MKRLITLTFAALLGTCFTLKASDNEGLDKKPSPAIRKALLYTPPAAQRERKLEKERQAEEKQKRIDRANASLHKFAYDPDFSTLREVNAVFATFRSDETKALSLRVLQDTNKKVQDHLPTCYCYLEWMTFLLQKDNYRNIILYCSHIEQIFDETWHAKDSFSALCHLYKAVCEDNSATSKAFKQIEQLYGEKIDETLCVYNPWSCKILQTCNRLLTDASFRELVVITSITAIFTCMTVL